MPLYALYLTSTGTHFYTVSLQEGNSAVKNRGYVYKGVVGFVATGTQDCKGKKSLVPIYRLYNPAAIPDYLYTSSQTKPRML